MNGEAKHTPGPWQVVNDNEGQGNPRPLWVVEGGNIEAFTNPTAENENAPYLRAYLENGVHADAVLMAAAPNLLEALEAIAAGAPTEPPPFDHSMSLSDWATRSEHYRLAQIARAALAKAKGDQ